MNTPLLDFVLGHHLDLQFEVPERRLTAFVEEVAALAMGRQNAVGEAPGVGVLTGFPAVRRRAVEERDPTVLGRRPTRGQAGQQPHRQRDP